MATLRGIRGVVDSVPVPCIEDNGEIGHGYVPVYRGCEYDFMDPHRRQVHRPGRPVSSWSHDVPIQVHPTMVRAAGPLPREPYEGIDAH